MKEAVNDEVLRRTVRDALVEFAPQTPESITGETSLVNELAYNSLAMLEVIFVLEEKLEIELVNDGTATQMRTVRDVEDYVLGLLAAARP